jgi:hypothetical protein
VYPIETKHTMFFAIGMALFWMHRMNKVQRLRHE